MKITFFGATREVTGSCYLVETEKTKLLIDCGMFQGSHFTSASNFKPLGFEAKTIDAVAVTHGHLDHVGRIPKLYKEGFRGKVYATPPTCEIARVIMEDAEQIMAEDLRRNGTQKLYERNDVEEVEQLMMPTDYGKSVHVNDLSIRFHDAGHIFGSSFIEVTEDGGKTAIFSGDLGNKNVPILRATEQLPAVDALVIESTYGNRVHEDDSTRVTRLHDAIVTTVKQNGVLVIPAFAVERTQQVLYELNHLVENRLIPAVDVYLDSPMAIKITDVIKKYPEYYNKEALALSATGDDLFDFLGLKVCMSRDDSKAINDSPRPKVIIAGSGMMNGGRIQHHLVRYLSDKRSTVLIIGYQSSGTLGRRLYSGEKVVDVLGEHVQVRANIVSIGAYSAHADKPQLIDFIKNAKALPKHVYCTHGEEDASAALATAIAEELHVTADVPRPGDTIEV
ncbi:MAG: MBL fold metallo-hydrolase [Patescibacteria group bacterium]